MTHPSANQLALYAWADLPEGEMRLVGNHLTDCPACRQSMADFELLQSCENSGAAEPAEEDLATVRSRVLAALHGPRASKSKARSLWLASAFTAATAALFLFTWTPYRKPEPTPILRISPVRPAAPVVLTASSKLPPIRRHSARTRPARGIRSVGLIAQASGTNLLQINTYDPSVVIYWQPSERTHQQ